MITITVTLEDYISAHRLHHKRRKLFYVFAAVAIAIGLILLFTQFKMRAPIFICAGIGGMLGQWWEDRFRFPKQVKKLYEQYKGINEPVELSWNEKLIEGKASNGQGKRKWSDYVCFKENDQVMLLYVTDAIWQVYPKHCFSSEQELNEFRKYAGVANDA